MSSLINEMQTMSPYRTREGERVQQGVMHSTHTCERESPERSDDA